MHKFFKGVAQIAKCEAIHIVEIRRAPAPQAPSVWKDPTRKIMEHSFYQRGVILNFKIYNWKLLIDGFLFLWYLMISFFCGIFDGFLFLGYISWFLLLCSRAVPCDFGPPLVAPDNRKHVS